MTVADARVLVTGGAGLIGRAVVDALYAAGARVRVLDVTESEAAESLVGSVADEATVARAVAGVDLVVHLAGLAGLDQGEPAAIYRANALGTFLVLDAAGRAGVTRTVYASSINANGLPLNPHPVLPSRYPWDEDEPVDISDAYSLSKQANEHAAAMVRRRYGVQVTGLRFPLVRELRLEGGAAFGRTIRDVVAHDPRRGAVEGWSYLDTSDAAAAVIAGIQRPVPAAPGILVAAPQTFLSTPTERALQLAAAGVPREKLSGTTVPLDLTRSRELLAFQATTLLDDVDPALLLDLEDQHA